MNDIIYTLSDLNENPVDSVRSDSYNNALRTFKEYNSCGRYIISYTNKYGEYIEKAVRL